MATVAALSDPYGNFLVSPRAGDGVCPISYSIAGEQLHHALAGYKRGSMSWMQTLTRQLAAVLWRHLALHEGCIARATGVERFPQVTVVPSGTASRTPPHPLEQIVAQILEPTRERYVPLLRRTAYPVRLHSFSPDRFAATTELTGDPVLLIDDTWTTGASAQSAAATLKKAGSGPIAAVVIGRHVNREWGDNDRRLRALPTPFDWSCCVCCEPDAPGSAPPGVEHAAPVAPGDR